ncbi:MAG: LysM peptidoglycan-binding domain-containing protein [Pseudomonadales bacterium]|nr:LysM peptidoglycan-binding domain-containing protein [Pseudomonadales bacterium]
MSHPAELARIDAQLWWLNFSVLKDHALISTQQILRTWPRALLPLLLAPLLAVNGCVALPQAQHPAANLTAKPTPASTSVVQLPPAATHDEATQDHDPVPAALLQDSSQTAVDGVPMADDQADATTMAPVTLDSDALHRFGDVWETLRAGFTLHPADNARILAQRQWFASHQGYIDRMTARATRYLGYTSSEAAKRHLPTELALLPIIESAYDPFALSRAQASGMWQFIPGTGKVFGLRESWWYDGRRDVIDSTRAAYDFLSSLHDKYHDWALVLAAYNAGPGLIDKAIARNAAQGLPTDYWSLSLPAETMAYVPRFMAIVQLVQQPELYSVHLTPIVNQSYFRVVSIPGQLDLAAAAKLAGISLQDLYALNPGFNHWATDPEGPQRILVPAETASTFDTALASLPPPQRVITSHYRVKRGDNLFRIAQRFGLSPAELQHLNHLHSRHLHRGQTLVVTEAQKPLDSYRQSEDQRVAEQVTQTASLHRIHVHVTRRESLAKVAKHYHVSTEELASWNGLSKKSVCKRGQQLTLLVTKTTHQPAKSIHEHAARHSDKHKIRYAVRRGDTLFSISRRYRVSVDEIRAWNHRRHHHGLHPGQDLVIYVAENSDDS